MVQEEGEFWRYLNGFWNIGIGIGILVALVVGHWLMAFILIGIQVFAELVRRRDERRKG